MTELDIMKHAKSYLDSLSQGIDPISGQPVPNDSVLNNVRLEKCFRYVSGVLEQVIANGGKVVSGAPVPFYITPPSRSGTSRINRWPTARGHLSCAGAAADFPAGKAHHRCRR